jgi:hypothetical protein
MKRIVLTFGLIAGAILSATMLLITIPFHEQIGFDRGMVVGYTSMLVAFLLVFFGVRAYRDQVAGGSVRFGRAFVVGSLIALVASACYVVTWEIYYYTFAPDFIESYQAYALDKARAEGASDAEIARQRAEMEDFGRRYQENPAFNAAVTLMEPLPVGLIVTLVSAGVLSRRRRDEDEPVLAVARS